MSKLHPLRLPFGISYIPYAKLDVHAPFKFGARTAPIDWKAIRDININSIICRTDITSLSNTINNIAFTKVNNDVDNIHLVKVIRLAQLIIEYLLYSQACYRHRIAIHEKRSKEAEERNEEVMRKYQVIKKRLGEVLEMHQWNYKESLSEYKDSSVTDKEIVINKANEEKGMTDENIEELYEKVNLLRERLLGADTAEILKLKKTITKLKSHFDNLEDEVLEYTRQGANTNQPLKLIESLYKTPRLHNAEYTSSRLLTQPTKHKA